MIDRLKPNDLNCNIFSVYEYDNYTMQELLCTFFEKINQCIDVSNATFDLAKWLVNEGLNIEVAKQLTQWLNDGTLSQIINQVVFKELNDKVNANTEYIKDISYNVKMFGAKGDDFTDDTIAIQKAIDAISLIGGGKVLFPTGKYVTTKAIYLPSRVTLVGSGSDQSTQIKKKRGGIRILDNTINYETMTRDDLIQYDACIVMESDGAYSGIRDINIRSFDGNIRCKWGLFAPYTQIDIFDNFTIYDFDESIRIFNAWNMNFNSVRTIRSEYGFRLEDNRGNVGACTSWIFNRVFCEYVDYAYKFIGLQYSSLNGICCDQVNKRAYWFDYSVGINISGMGCENSTCQLIRSHHSEITINGFFFLGISPMNERPIDMKSTSLIEIDSDGRVGCGLILNSGEFKNDTSGLTKLYASTHATINVTNMRSWDGKSIIEYDPLTNGKIVIDNLYELRTSTPILINDLTVDKYNSGYKNDNYFHSTGYTVYNDINFDTNKTVVNIPKSQLAKNFNWVTGTDNYMWIPLKISVGTDYHGSCNNIWYAHNSIKTDNAIEYGNGSIISSVSTDSNNIIFTLKQPTSRIKIVFSLA